MDENLEEEDLELGLAGDGTVVRLVNLVLLQAFSDDATKIVFALEESTAGKDLEFLFDSEAHGDELASARRFNVTIRYYSPHKFHDIAPPPTYLFRPIINRLCVMADIRHWARGPVEGFFSVVIGGVGQISCTAHSHNLNKELTLSRATAGKLEAFGNRKPIALPPLPKPLPDEPVPEFVIRPVPSPDIPHTIVWFISRTVFYGFAHIAVLSLVTFNASLKSALPRWLCAGLEFTTKALELPGSLLPFGGYPWQGPVMTFAFWGMGIACFVQCSTKRRA